MDNSKEMQLMLKTAMKAHPEAFAGFDTTKNLQDQLQEMYLKGMPDGTYNKIYTLLEAFYDYFAVNGYPSYATSMEQLWLSFVMKELYQKIWVNNEWKTEG